MTRTHNRQHIFFFWRRAPFSLSLTKMYVGFSFSFAPPKPVEKMLRLKFANTSKAETSSWVYFSCSCDCRNTPEKDWGHFILPTALSTFTYIPNCPFSSNVRHFVEGYRPRSVSFNLVWNSGLFHAKWTRRKARSFNSKPTGTHPKLRAKKLPKWGVGFL